MKKGKSCYTCKHVRICKLRYMLTHAMHENVGMLNTESDEEPKAVHVFASIAVCCKEFDRDVESET